MNIQLSFHFVQALAQEQPRFIGTSIRSSNPKCDSYFRPSRDLAEGLSVDLMRHCQIAIHWLNNPSPFADQDPPEGFRAYPTTRKAGRDLRDLHKFFHRN